MATHAPGSWFLAPATNPTDEYVAGYDCNTFASESEALAAIPRLQQCGEEFAIEWVAMRRAATISETIRSGHTLTIDLDRMHMTIAGPTETMDAIPDAEIHALCRTAGVRWLGEVVDETSYVVRPLTGWVVDGKGTDRDFGRVFGGEVAWVRGACRTPVAAGMEWFESREEAEAACEEV